MPRTAFLVWNRRVHCYLGLYLLFFGWLFALTGLLLNHSTWEFTQFWPSRVQSQCDARFSRSRGLQRLGASRDLMQQFGIAGEIQWPAAHPVGGPFTFQVSRPGRTVEVKADLATGQATLQRTDLNAWGVMHVLHAFVGVRSCGSCERARMVLDDALGAINGRRRRGACDDGLEQLHHVVPAETQTPRRCRGLASRLP